MATTNLPNLLPSNVGTVPDTGSANETLIDLFMERAVDLLRLEAGTTDKVLVFIDQLQSDLITAIAKIDPTGTPTDVAQKARLNALLKIVQSTIKGTYRDSATLMGAEIRNVADSEATWTGNALNASMGVDFATVGFTRTFLDTLVSDVLIQGAPSATWWGRQAAGLSDRFADEMRRGMAMGENNSDLIARVRGKSGQTGLMDISRNSAERLVRASVQTAANAARLATYDQNSDLIASLMWSATLDTRTTIECLARDGHLYSNDGNYTAKDGGPPWLEGPGALHWGCRSTSVPMLKSWQDLGIDTEEVPQSTRASMDGQVPAQQTFASWLKKQSDARQDTILGVGKAQLYRDGKISVRDLLDQNGRPLSTEQLRAKYTTN